MLNLSSQEPSNTKKARLRNRLISSFEEVDLKIQRTLIQLELDDDNLWTDPEYNKNEFVHSIFQYPAMMVPEVQRQIIDVILQNSNSDEIESMIDPFMGSATSLVSSMHYGLNCYGQDINPLALLISKVRTSLVTVNFKTLKSKANLLFELIKVDTSTAVEVNFKGQDRWFTLQAISELSKIVRAIRLESDLLIRRFYWANLAEVIRICSNDRTSTFKLHRRPIEELEVRYMSPIQELRKMLNQSVNSYIEFKSFLRKKGRLSKTGYVGKINIEYGDSSKGFNFKNQKRQFADILVSSPPYGDNHTTVTYGQYSYLQLQWIDLKDIDSNIDSSCLLSTAEIDSRSIGGKRSSNETDKMSNVLLALSPSFRNDYLAICRLDKQRRDKIIIFLYDLYKVLINSLSILKKDAYMIWTMGNRNVGTFQVNNIDYLREILESNNCVLVHSITRGIVNKRMAKKNKDTTLMNTEEILVLRKLS